VLEGEIEQAARKIYLICNFLGHGDNEDEYFILSLKKRF
jgi:hypothetical protein